MTTELVLILFLTILAWVFRPTRKKTLQEQLVSQKGALFVTSAMSIGFVLGYRLGHREGRADEINKFGHIDSINWFSENLGNTILGQSDIKSIDSLTVEEKEKLVHSFLDNILKTEGSTVTSAFVDKIRQNIEEAMILESAEGILKNTATTCILYLSNIHQEIYINNPEGKRANELTFLESVDNLVDTINLLEQEKRISKELKISTLKSLLAALNIIDNSEELKLKIEKSIKNIANLVE
jgi:hypothetical protein